MSADDFERNGVQYFLRMSELHDALHIGCAFETEYALAELQAKRDLGERAVTVAGLITQAVAGNLGIGLVPRCLLEKPIARSEVAIVFDSAGEARLGHYLCVPRGRRSEPAVGLFRDWLAREVRAFPAVPQR